MALGRRAAWEMRWEELGAAVLPGALVSVNIRHCWRGHFFISLVPRVSHICTWPELLSTPWGGFLLPVSPCRVLQELGGGTPKVSPPIPWNTGPGGHVSTSCEPCSSQSTHQMFHRKPHSSWLTPEVGMCRILAKGIESHLFHISGEWWNHLATGWRHDRVWLDMWLGHIFIAHSFLRTCIRGVMWREINGSFLWL